MLENGVTISPIGTIRTPYKTKEACPIQGIAQPLVRGTIHLLPEYEPGLTSIESFTHIYLIYLFDRAGEVLLQRAPFLDDAPKGLFATRHPCRPNGIGLSIVRLLGRRGAVLDVAEVDMLDNTPLLDIKPLVPKFDARPEAGNGWVAGRGIGHKPAGRE